MNAPWKWSESGTQLLDGTGRTVLRILPSDATQEEFYAIVAVPEMLRALKRLEKVDLAWAWNDDHSVKLNLERLRREIADVCREAIAKAEGNTP